MAASFTSDIFHEYSCTPCRDDGVNREAEVYCVNCKEYLCKRCLRSHNRVPEAREHQLLGKEEFQQVTILSTNCGIPDLPTERCVRHHGKLVDMFCVDHDVVGCNICMLQHRACKDVFYIPDIAKSRVTKQSVQTIQDAITTLQHKTTAIKNRRVENQLRIAQEKGDCLNTVLERRKEIEKHLDKIQNVQRTNIIDKFNEFNSKLGVDIKSCDQSIALLDQSQKNLSVFGSKRNTSQTFIHMKQSEQILSKADKDLKEMDKNMNDSLSLHYKTDADIQDVLLSSDLFGSLQTGIPTHADHLEFVGDINIKIDSDTNICNSFDLCQLPDGTIIVTDWENKSIKSLTYDTAYKLNDSLVMFSSPWGVCCINDNGVAVTMPGDNKVEIVTIKPKMAIKGSFKVYYRCHGIEYHDGNLYVVHFGDKQVTVYDLEGTCLHTHQTDQKGVALFRGPRHLCVIPDKQQIAVADGNKGLVVIEMSGHLVTEYTYTNIKCTYSVCIEDRGNLIVADYRSKQIVAVVVNKTYRTLLSNMDKRPQAVLFDKQTKRL